MLLSKKIYNKIKERKYLKSDRIILFINGTNQKSGEWLITKQELKELELYFYKVFNKTAQRNISESICKNIKPLINGITFFIKLSNSKCFVNKNKLFDSLENFLLFFLAIKLNNKIYSTTQLKLNKTTEYQINLLLLKQFLNTNFKTST